MEEGPEIDVLQGLAFLNGAEITRRGNEVTPEEYNRLVGYPKPIT